MPRPSDRRLPVIVLGGGLAGLTAASVLHRHGVPVIVYEAGAQLAGLARSFAGADGFSHDFGAHFITNRLAAALGAGADCQDVRRYDEAVLLCGRSYGYPFGLLGEPRFALSGAWELLRRGAGGAAPSTSAAEWFRSVYGTALAERVAIPIIEAWSGEPAERLAAAVGDKLPASILRTVLLHVAARLSRRAVAVGYCAALPESPNVWHVYPRGGVEVLCRRLAASLDVPVRLESPVEKILVEQGRVVGVRAAGREQPAAAVISTAPVSALPRLVEGTDALRHLARFRYRAMIFVNLRFRGRGLLPRVVLWTPEADLPFFRLTEAPLAVPWLAPPGRTLITADLGCDKGDPMWTLSDEQIGELCLTHLRRIVPDAQERYLGCRVLRTPVAYPVFLRDYEAERQALTRTTGVAGLLSVGRNGEFAHLLMEDVYWRTLTRVRVLARRWLEGDDVAC